MWQTWLLPVEISWLHLPSLIHEAIRSTNYMQEYSVFLLEDFRCQVMKSFPLTLMYATDRSPSYRLKLFHFGIKAGTVRCLKYRIKTLLLKLQLILYSYATFEN